MQSHKTPMCSKRTYASSSNVILSISIIGDIAMICLGLLFGFWFRFKSPFNNISGTTWAFSDYVENVILNDYIKLIITGLILLLITLFRGGLYQCNNLLRFNNITIIVIRSAITWLVAYLFISLALKFTPPISRFYAISSFAGVVTLILLWRYSLVKIIQKISFSSSLRQRVLFIGWNSDAFRLALALECDKFCPYTVVGYVDSSGQIFDNLPPTGIPKLGSVLDLDKILRDKGVNVAIFTDWSLQTQEILRIMNLCEREFVRIKVVPSMFQILISCLSIETINGVPILGLDQLPLEKFTNRFIKRIIDVFGGFVGLTLFLPVLVVVSILIYLESPGPILFKQERVGRGGCPFIMLKLRSMRLDADKYDHLNQSTLRGDPRLLRIGAFIRQWNLDEVPQFWNVIVGQMSLVGPRPERTFHSNKLSHEIPHYNSRLSVKPGMTGWAQINGLRGDTDLFERVRFDLYYLEKWSLLMDFQIMFKTLLIRKNAY